ncbi:MAG: PqqD family protein [Acidobacteriota bacterium]
MRMNVRLPRALTEDLVIRELDDETLVYDKERDEAHCLNQTAALVWELCDGKTTAAQAARCLASKLGTPVDTDIVWLAVKKLKSFHLVESNGNVPSVSRRNLVLKYAPLALALPVIMSIGAPTRAGGVVSCGQPCNGQTTCPLGCICDFSNQVCVPNNF